MHVIDFFVILKFCVKQLTFFERTVLAASDFKNCTMVYCEYYCSNFLKKFYLFKLNYIDSKKSATSWKTNINKSGTMPGPVSMLKTLNKNKKY